MADLDFRGHAGQGGHAGHGGHAGQAGHGGHGDFGHGDSAQDFVEKVIHVNRVAKVVKGGRRFSFAALVVIGDGRGRVGVGQGKANEVPDAIRKAVDKAKKNIFSVPLTENASIPHVVAPEVGRYGAAKVLLKPASAGTGVIAGGAVRAVVESAGIQDILSKCLGTTNKHNVVNATVDALSRLRRVENVANARSKEIDDVGHDYPVQKMSASSAAASSIVASTGGGSAGGAAS